MRRIRNVNAAVPTVVFAVSDGAGHALSDVKVRMDGEVLAERLDGTELAVDPGSHVFSFESSGWAPKTETIILYEGDKLRRESVTLASLGASSDGNATSDAGHQRRVLGLVSGGVGVAGLLVGSIFGAMTFSAWSDVTSKCPSYVGCSAQAMNDHSNAQTFGAVSTAGFIVGGVLLATGLTLYFTAPKQPDATFGVKVTAGGVGVTGTF